MVEEFRFGYLFNFDIFGIGYVYWIKNICRLRYIYIFMNWLVSLMFMQVIDLEMQIVLYIL